MKKILILLVLLAISTVELPSESSSDLSIPAPMALGLAGNGKDKFGGKKEQNRRNRQTRRINRKNGVGYHYTPNPSANWAYMLPNIDWKKGGKAL